MRRYIYLFLFSLSSFPVLGQYQHLLHKSYAERFLALDTLFYNNRVAAFDSVDFFKEVNEIESLARENKDKDLLLESQLLRLEYYMIGKHSNHQKFLEQIPALIEKADDLEIKHLQIRARQKLGYFYFNIAQEYGHGLESYLESYNLMKGVPVSELPDKQEMIAAIGRACYKLGESAKAREFLALAQKVPPSYKKRQAINNTNFIGLIYRLENKYDSALYYFNEAYEMARAGKDSVWMGIASGNIGITYFLQGKTTEAIPLLKFDIEESLKAGERGNAVNSMIVLAKVYIKENKLDEARQLTDKGISLLNLTGDPTKYGAELFLLKAGLLEKAGDYRAAYNFLDSARVLQNEVQERLNLLLHERAEGKLELAQYRAQVEQTKQQQKLGNLMVMALLGFVMLIGVIIILMINRKRMLLKEKQKQLQHEKETIETELELAVRQLKEFTASIREKNKIIEELSSNDPEENLSRDASPEEIEKGRLIHQLLNSTILTDEQWDNFLQLFEKVHKGFMIRLREKLPQITPADTRFILLSKLNLTPREMASMLGVRPDAIRLYRHRLKKKLSLQEDESIHDLINKI